MKYEFYLMNHNTISMNFEHEGTLGSLKRAAKKTGCQMGLGEFRIYVKRQGEDRCELLSYFYES